MITKTTIAAFAGLMFVAPLHATEPVAKEATSHTTPWYAVNAATGQIRDIEGLEGLAKAFPHSSSVRLRLLNSQLQAGEIKPLLGTLRWLHDRGYVFNEGARLQIPKLLGEEYAEEAQALLLPQADPIEGSSLSWKVLQEAGLVESVYLNTELDVIIVSSVTEKGIWVRQGDRDWVSAKIEKADNVSGLAGFTDTQEFWIASGNIDGSEEAREYFSGLIGSVPGSGEPRIPAPDGVTLSDLHAAADRTIFASDPLGGGVYKLGPDREKIETVVEPGTLRSPQGLASSADGKKLYVSDYRYGIAIIDLMSGQVSQLASDVPLILDGTDALFRHDNSLIAIQNGTSPMRISQFYLSDDGLRVTGSRILEQAHTEWTEPLSGSLVDGVLYYVGNGQWDKYVGGVLGQDKQPEATDIRRLPID